MKNIILIGMPAVGKSTAGVLLAKRLGWSFIDTDILIQVQEGRQLQDIINIDGMDSFCNLEERCILTLSGECRVIATGGSVVYRRRAMEHLRSLGWIAHLDLPPDLLTERLNNISSRGVVMAQDQNIESLYTEREPLYLKYADNSIPCRGLSPDQMVSCLLDAYKKTA